MRHKAPAQRSDTRWTDADTQRLREGLERLSMALDETAFGKVLQWAMLLKQWNRTYNLLGNSDSNHLIDEHLLDSLAIVPVLERYLPQPDEALVDVGTGAGFPGILLAIVHPQRPIYLVEPVGKKVAFLRQSVLTLGLKNATVLAGKIEDLESLIAAARAARKGGAGSKVGPASNVAEAEASDTDAPPQGRQVTQAVGTQTRRDLPRPPHFICRAFTALGRFASLCEPYMSNDSLLFAMKSLRLSEEQQELPANVVLQAVEPLPTIDLGIQRNLAILALAGSGRNSFPPSAAPASSRLVHPAAHGILAPEVGSSAAPRPPSEVGAHSHPLPPPSAQPNRRSPQ